MANSSNWKLIRYQPESFAGINKDMGIVVKFPKDKKIMAHTGDQGSGKTSSLECLKLLMGAEPVSNAINSTDETMAGELEIEQDDHKYIARFNKSNFIVTLVQADGTKSKISEPKSFLKKLIGPQGSDPMFLKDKDGKKQIEWIRTLFSLSKEDIEMEQQIKTSYDKSYKERTAINKDIARLKVELNGSEYFSFDKENKVYLPTPKLMEDKKKLSGGATDAELINKNFRDLQSKKDEASRAEALMSNLHANAATIEREIEDLQKRLAIKAEELTALNQRIVTGTEHNRRYETVTIELEAAQKAVESLHENKAAETAIKTAEVKLSEYCQKIDQSIVLNAKVDETQLLIRKFIKSFTPEIEGLEVKVPSVIDVEFETEAYKVSNPGTTDRAVFMHVESLKSDNVEGIFYHGKSIVMMSESELYSLCIKLWEFMGVRVIFIENITSLGSEAISIINMFAEKGYVFYSEMDRKQKDLKIHFHNKIS